MMKKGKTEKTDFKQQLRTAFGHLMTVLILLQAVLCFFLLYRTASGRDSAIFGYRFYYIVSPSMEPTIHTGAEIVVKEVDPYTLEKGDIITFISADPSIQGHSNTHRIHEIITDDMGRRTFVTKGDNNKEADAYLVYPEDIYGKVVIITPALRGLVMFYSFAATPAGFMVVVVMPLLLVCGMFMRSFMKELRASLAAAGTLNTAGTAAEQVDPAQLNQLIAAAVTSYQKQNPGHELTPEEAAQLAAKLIQAVAVQPQCAADASFTAQEENQVQQIADQQIADQQIADQQIEDQQIADQQIADQPIEDQQRRERKEESHGQQSE